MITREEAAALLAQGLFGTTLDLARTVVALYDERDALRAELDTFTGFHRAKKAELARAIDALSDERDALALELRRLRAAEAPGTDDAAFEGTGWTVHCGDSWWHLNTGEYFTVEPHNKGGWRVMDHTDRAVSRFPIALDAMRAAVPGSV